MPENTAFNLELLLSNGLDLSPDCIGILDQNDTVIYCNNTFAGIFSLSKKETIGRSNYQLLKSSWLTRHGIKINTDNFDQWYENIVKLQEEKSLNQFETDLTDGRWFKMTRVNMDNGYILLLGVNITDLKQTQSSLEKANKHIEKLANTDQLTGMKNRRSFNLLTEQEIKKAKRYHQPLSLLMIDIDYFKNVNDTFGHESGDHILCTFANTCAKLIRESDLLCRIGGEEFTILLPKTNIRGANKIAEMIRSHIAATNFHLPALNCSTNISISIGVSTLKDSEQTIKETLSRADRALYSAKRNGRNQIMEYSFNMQEQD